MPSEDFRQEMIEKAIRRERRLAQLEEGLKGLTDGATSTQGVLRSMQEKYRTLYNVVEELDTPAVHKDYKFKTGALSLVSLADIAVDVDRNNPVVEVVLQGTKYREFHQLLLHISFFLKMRTLADNKDAVSKTEQFNSENWQAMIVILQSLQSITPTVFGFSVGSTTYNFAHIMNALRWALDFPLRQIDLEPQTIIVRYR